MNNDGSGCRRFILVDDEYNFFFDHHHRSGDNNFLPPFDDGKGESETRKFSGDSRRRKLSGTEKKPINNRVPQRETRESIQRDNRVAERRKRKMAELDLESARNQVNIQRDKKAREVKVDTLRDVTDADSVDGGGCKRFILVDDEYTLFLDCLSDDNTFLPPFEDDNSESETRSVSMFSCEKKPINNNRVSQKRRKTIGSNADVSRASPLVTSRESIQRDNRAAERRKRKMAEFEATRVDIQGDNKARKVSESKVNTSTDVPLVKNPQVIHRDSKEAIRRENKIAERRKKKTDETKASGTSRVVSEPKAVNKTPRFVPVTQSNNRVSVGTRKKNVAVAEKDYTRYLTWLVDSLKDSTTVPGPTPGTQKQSTMAPEKDLRAKVKVELDTESCSDDDDDDVIMVSDSPFLCGGSTPFVVSKSKTVIDLEKDSTEDESISSAFTKELMDVLEKPYDKEELLRLSGEVSEKKPVSRCRELRKGRVSNYETSELGPSYLEKVSDFDKEYRRVDDDDKVRLKLLRGFFYYLKNVTRAGSFKPWLPENQKKLGLKRQCLQPLRVVNLFVK